ncbi:MAG: hypothetical protein JRH20_21300 [Deltaproteobacteria bacterium]|nr:hypothetical protein [Deltaproteobacteria bacterium]
MHKRVRRHICVSVLVSCCLLVFGSDAWAGGRKSPKPGRKAKASSSGKAQSAQSARKSSPSARRSAQSARPPQAAAAASPNAVRANSAGELVFGQAIRYHNLSLVPVGTRAQGPFQRYLLLEEGLASGELRVRELRGNNSRAQVSQVEVRNQGADPVYLLGGEMILGGKQDRIIQADTVIENDKRWHQVAVFCVEQNRWAGQKTRFRSGSAIAHVALRRAAMSGSQSKVWAEVARKNLRHGTQSSTQTYRRTIQNKRLRKKIAPYRRRLLALLPKDMRLAGMVFAINGKIRVADLFGNPLLFDGLKEKLLSAYVLEALGNQVKRNARPLSTKAAARWLSKRRKAKHKRVKNSGRAINYDKESAEAVGRKTVDRKTGKMLRESYIAK